MARSESLFLCPQRPGLESGCWRSRGTQPHWSVESVASGTWGPATGQLRVWYQPVVLRISASSFVHSGSRTCARYLRVLQRAPQEVPQISSDPFPGLYPSPQLGNVFTLMSLQLAHVTASQRPAGSSHWSVCQRRKRTRAGLSCRGPGRNRYCRDISKVQGTSVL